MPWDGLLSLAACSLVQHPNSLSHLAHQVTLKLSVIKLGGSPQVIRGMVCSSPHRIPSAVQKPTWRTWACSSKACRVFCPGQPPQCCPFKRVLSSLPTCYSYPMPHFTNEQTLPITEAISKITRIYPPVGLSLAVHAEYLGLGQTSTSA